MKKLIIRALIQSILIITTVHTCPTCIGRLDVDTPPLFSQAYEKLYTEYEDDMPESVQLEERDSGEI